MTINEEARQLEIAGEVEEAARSLAHSTRTLPHPSDSYLLLGELRQTADHLAQTLAQLAAWHQNATDGAEYNGEDGDTTGSPAAAAVMLRAAAQAVELASTHIGQAHAHNGFVRWYGSPVDAA